MGAFLGALWLFVVLSRVSCKNQYTVNEESAHEIIIIGAGKVSAVFIFVFDVIESWHQYLHDMASSEL